MTTFAKHPSRRFFAFALTLPVAFGTAAFAQSKPAAASGTGIRPGLWETTQVIEDPATTARRTVTSQVCYSADDVKSIARILPQQHEAPLKCRNTDVVLGKDGTAGWRIACTGPKAMLAGTGRMEIAPELLSAHARLVSKSRGKSGKVEQTITAKWVSDCK